MSNPGEGDLTPIDGLSQLASYFDAGCKPAEKFRIGTEHEKFGFRRDDFSPPRFWTRASPSG
jgi:glutamate--cysteine ligase